MKISAINLLTKKRFPLLIFIVAYTIILWLFNNLIPASLLSFLLLLLILLCILFISVEFINLYNQIRENIAYIFAALIVFYILTAPEFRIASLFFTFIGSMLDVELLNRYKNQLSRNNGIHEELNFSLDDSKIKHIKFVVTLFLFLLNIINLIYSYFHFNNVPITYPLIIKGTIFTMSLLIIDTLLPYTKSEFKLINNTKVLLWKKFFTQLKKDNE